MCVHWSLAWPKWGHGAPGQGAGLGGRGVFLCVCVHICARVLPCSEQSCLASLSSPPLIHGRSSVDRQLQPSSWFQGDASAQPIPIDARQMGSPIWILLPGYPWPSLEVSSSLLFCDSLVPITEKTAGGSSTPLHQAAKQG